MSADGLRSVPRHEADDDSADRGDDDDEPAEAVVGRRDEGGRDAAVECDVRDQADEPDEQLRDEPGDDSEEN